jgi:hypothetical protein
LLYRLFLAYKLIQHIQTCKHDQKYQKNNSTYPRINSYDKGNNEQYDTHPAKLQAPSQASQYLVHATPESKGKWNVLGIAEGMPDDPW